LDNLTFRSVATKFVCNNHVFTIFHRLALSASNQFWEIGVIIFSEKESLLVAKKVFLVVIFECKAGRGACGGKAEFIDNFFPQFVMRYSLASAFFAYGFVEFEEVKFLAADLRDFDLSDAFGAPVFREVFLKFVFLF